MTPRRTLRRLGLSKLMTALALSIFAYAGSLHAVAAEETANDGAADFMPGSERGSARPPATFFSINAVLAKLDRQRGRGPDAIRLASLTPANVATDAPALAKEAPPIGK